MHTAVIVNNTPKVYIIYPIATKQPVNKRHNRYSVIKFEYLLFIDLFFYYVSKKCRGSETPYTILHFNTSHYVLGVCGLKHTLHREN